ncbi:O-antigen ligase family protein [Nocardioides stalactiti]
MVLFLVGHHKDALSRLFLAGFVGVSLLSVTMSGSRAAIVVLVVVILLVPIVERSAMIGFAFAICAALGVVALPFIVDISGEESAIGRLAGSGTATASDEVRNEAFDYGLERLGSSPIFGTGFSDVEQIHNVFLEAAVAIGVLGLVSYLIVLFALARPLFTQHPMRRLTYMIWVFIGVAPTFPGLWDRTVWVPASVAALAMIAPRTTNAPADPEVGPARADGAADGAGSVSPGVSPGRA